MKLRAEISMYPLSDNFIPFIDDVIARLKSHEGITLSTNELSTQIYGDYDKVMHILNQEMKLSFKSDTKMVFVAKFHCPGE
jgi:uncharacterized protein YqgV (UPF0045/DUF77 family)